MWNANSKMYHLVESYLFLKDTLKESLIKDNRYHNILKDSDSVESVSVLSASLSASISTWGEQKWARLTSAK